MLETLGDTQGKILRELRSKSDGLSVNDIVSRLAITKTAVRQHLTTMIAYGYVEHGTQAATGGRPGNVYRLSDRGKELFPRQYSWFSEVMLEAMKKEKGPEGLARWIEELGRVVGTSLKPQLEGKKPAEQTAALVEIMNSLAYEAKARPAAAKNSLPGLEAANCVYHGLATKFPEVCRFDLALIASATGFAVEHQTCMVKGSDKCRFAFSRK